MIPPPVMVVPILTIKLQPTAYSTRISKVEFPLFDGKNMKEWLYKCTQFFSMDVAQQKLPRFVLPSIYLNGIALRWLLNYMHYKFDVYPSWSQYIVDVA